MCLASRRSDGYHNKEWAAKMESLGLQPSSTGAVGGKRTGQRVSHYIIPDGPFTKAFANLAATGWKLNLQSAHRPGATKGPNSKTKFTCSSCGQNAWGKLDLAILCMNCFAEQHPEIAVDYREAMMRSATKSDGTARSYQATSLSAHDELAHPDAAEPVLA